MWILSAPLLWERSCSPWSTCSSAGWRGRVETGIDFARTWILGGREAVATAGGTPALQTAGPRDSPAEPALSAGEGQALQTAGHAESVIRIVKFRRDAGAGRAAAGLDVMPPGTAPRRPPIAPLRTRGIVLG